MSKKKQLAAVCTLVLISIGVLQLHSSIIVAAEEQEVIAELTDGRKVYQVDVGESGEFENEGDALRQFSAGHSTGRIGWQGMYSTPLIKLEGTGYVYCIEPFAPVPNGQIYGKGTPIDEPGVQAILEAGFPRNRGTLSEHDAYIRTFVALNAYRGAFNRKTVESYGDAYVNKLLAQANKAKKKEPNATIKEPKNMETSYNEATKRVESDVYEVTGKRGTFSIEGVPADVYTVNEAGERTTRFTIGEKFRFVSDKTELNTNVHFNVKTNVPLMQAMEYKAKGVQKLVALEEKPRIEVIASRVAIRPVKMGQQVVEKEEPDNEKKEQPMKPITVTSQKATPQKKLVSTGENDGGLLLGGLLVLVSSSVLIARLVAAGRLRVALNKWTS